MPVHLVLTVLTMNVLQTHTEPERRYEAIAEALHALRPDVVTLQEVERLPDGRTSVDGLATDLFPYRVVDGRFGAYHLAVLSRHPILRWSRVPFENNPERMALIAAVQTPQGEVTVATVHLDFQYRHNRQRIAQLRQVLARVAGYPGPVVLTGDFNFGDGVPEEGAIPPEWLDAWRTLRPREDGYTWDNDRNALAHRHRMFAEPSRRLDRVYSRGLVPRDVRVVLDEPIGEGLFASDHFAVWARLESGR